MAKKQKEIVYKEKKFQPFYKLVFGLVGKKIFKEPRKIINLAGEIEDRAIILPNHSAKSGPPTLHLRFPKKTAQWGAYQMLGGYKMRKAYLRDVLAIQKLGQKPGFKTSFRASLMAMFSLKMYRGMHMIPSFPDNRMISTLRFSEQVLQKNMPVIIYAENSNDGYHEVLKELFPGFVSLAKYHYTKTGEDLPVYPTYLHIKKRILVIDKPLYVNAMLNEGKNREEIAEIFLNKMNQLFYDYVQNEPDIEKKKEK